MTEIGTYVAVERGERVVVEVAVDLAVRHVRAVVGALALLVALLGLAVAAGARDVRRVAGLAEPVERREHGAEVLAELARAVRVRRAAGLAAGRAAAEVVGVRAAAAQRAAALPWPWP